jgi:hypothetical protein
MARIGFTKLDAVVAAGCTLGILALAVYSYVYSGGHGPFAEYLVNPAFTPYLVAAAF